MNGKKVILAAFVVLALVLFFVLDLGRFITLDYFIRQRDVIIVYYETNRVMTAAAYFLI